MNRAIILAGGKGDRWDNYLGVPKHLIEVDGETLIARTARGLRERKMDVVILGPSDDPRYHVPGTQVHDPAFVGDETDKHLSAMLWWVNYGLTTVTYGDAWLSEDVMDALALRASSFRVVGRANGSAYTGKGYGEPWGYSFTPDGQGRLAQAIVTTKARAMAGIVNRGNVWDIYRDMVGLPLNDHVVVGRFVDIDGWSEDFDNPADYDNWITRRNAHG